MVNLMETNIFGTYATRKEKELEERVALAERIRKNVEETYRAPDKHLGRHGNVTSDPLYQKLNCLAGPMPTWVNSDETWRGVWGGLHNLKSKIEDRSMKEKTYKTLLQMPDKKLMDYLYAREEWFSEHMA